MNAKTMLIKPNTYSFVKAIEFLAKSTRKNLTKD
jgi:hypothetical protein